MQHEVGGRRRAEATGTTIFAAQSLCPKLPESRGERILFRDSWDLSRIFREISCAHFSWKFKDENRRQKFAKFSLRFSPFSANFFARISLLGLFGLTKLASQNRSDHGGRERASNHFAAEIAGFFALPAANNHSR